MKGNGSEGGILDAEDLDCAGHCENAGEGSVAEWTSTEKKATSLVATAMIGTLEYVSRLSHVPAVPNVGIGSVVCSDCGDRVPAESTVALDMVGLSEMRVGAGERALAGGK